MWQILVTEEFKKNYVALPVDIQKKAAKQENFFRLNPFYPSLRTEKLEPKNKQVWSFRIDKSYHIIFRFLEKNKILFLTVGHHRWIYRFISY